MLLVGTAAAVLALSGSGVAARPEPMSEVVVTLKAPPLSRFGRALFSARHAAYSRELTAARVSAERQVLSALPNASIRWEYSVVANGFAVVAPKSEVARLSSLPSVERVWPNVRYHALLDRSPEVIGADKLWGPTFA